MVSQTWRWWSFNDQSCDPSQFVKKSHVPAAFFTTLKASFPSACLPKTDQFKENSGALIKDNLAAVSLERQLLLHISVYHKERSERSGRHSCRMFESSVCETSRWQTEWKAHLGTRISQLQWFTLQGKNRVWVWWMHFLGSFGARLGSGAIDISFSFFRFPETKPISET